MISLISIYMHFKKVIKMIILIRNGEGVDIEDRYGEGWGCDDHTKART